MVNQVKRGTAKSRRLRRTSDVTLLTRYVNEKRETIASSLARGIEAREAISKFNDRHSRERERSLNVGPTVESL